MNMSLENGTTGLYINTSLVNDTEKTNPANDSVIAYSFVIVMNSLQFVCIVLSIVILISIGREGYGKFFQWKIFDRFTVYNVLGDLLLNITGFVAVLSTGLLGSLPTEIIHLCTLTGISALLFPISQTLVTTITAVFVYVLIVHNRHLNLGKYDWILYLTVFVFPLALLIALAVLNKRHVNKGYCNLQGNSGISSWHYGLTSVLIIALFVVITAVYCILFGFILWRRRQATNILQNSAVNKTRLAVKLSMYVVAHFIQFVTSAIEAMLPDPPVEIYRAAILCNAVGGVFNAVVYFSLRKR